MILIRCEGLNVGKDKSLEEEYKKLIQMLHSERELPHEDMFSLEAPSFLRYTKKNKQSISSNIEPQGKNTKRMKSWREPPTHLRPLDSREFDLFQSGAVFDDSEDIQTPHQKKKHSPRRVNKTKNCNVVVQETANREEAISNSGVSQENISYLAEEQQTMITDNIPCSPSLDSLSIGNSSGMFSSNPSQSDAKIFQEKNLDGKEEVSPTSSPQRGFHF